MLFLESFIALLTGTISKMDPTTTAPKEDRELSVARQASHQTVQYLQTRYKLFQTDLKTKKDSKDLLKERKALFEDLEGIIDDLFYQDIEERNAE